MVEKAARKALPSAEYDGGQWKNARHPDSMLPWMGHYYSAPHIHRHKSLRIKLTEHDVEFVLNLERLAIHPRCRQKTDERFKVLEHFPASSRVLREIAGLHVIEHALTKLCHG